jgi:ABC-type nitrate/sulfonate/bicarbonate transport system ATPase subunit
MSFITINHLVKNYGTLNVLSYLSFSIQKGEIVTILGPSGSGKSTLLKCVVGIDNDYLGEIFINGKNQSEYLTDNRISLVSQNYSNFPWLNVKQNIELGLASGNSNNAMGIEEIIETIELKKFESYFPSQLSGGMQQRVAIGRSIAQNTEVVALDEPFGALDFMTRASLQLFLKSLNRKLNKTLIFVTHDIDEALFISDRIIILSKQPTVIANEIIVPEDIRVAKDNNIRYSQKFIELKVKIESILNSLSSLNFIREIFESKDYEKLKELSFWNTFLMNECRRLYKKELTILEQEDLSIRMLSSNDLSSMIIGSLLHADISSPVIKSKLNELFSLHIDDTDATAMYFLIHSITNIDSSPDEKEYYYGIVKKRLQEYLLLEKKYFTCDHILNDNIILNIIESRFFGHDNVVNLGNKGWLLLLSALSHPNIDEVKDFYKRVQSSDEYKDDVFLQKVISELFNTISHVK